MIFPIGDDQVIGGHKPFVSYAIIALNVMAYVFQFFIDGESLQRFIYTFGTIPVEILNGEDLFTLISSIFLHGGWMHLAGNMVFLWVFGDNIEATIGSKKFILFYLIGGIVAGYAHAFSNPISQIPCVGASGSIAAILGAYLVMFPKSRIELLVLIFFSSFRISAFYFLGIWIVQQVISGIGEIGPSTEITSGVAWWAHIGGFLFGVIAGFLFLRYVGEPRYKYHEDDY